jgi:uncharacterized membrane protein
MILVIDCTAWKYVPCRERTPHFRRRCIMELLAAAVTIAHGAVDCGRCGTGVISLMIIGNRGSALRHGRLLE